MPSGSYPGAATIYFLRSRFPLESILPAQAGVALPHLVPLAPNVGQIVRPLAGGALALQLLVEGALLLQVVALRA